MATTECALQSLASIEHHLNRLSAVIGVGELLDAVTTYLESWPKVRISSLQKIDGGWGAFDHHQRFGPIDGVADIAWISEALSNHCRALREARLEPTPELLELDLYFALATQIAEAVNLGGLKSYAMPQLAAKDHSRTARRTA